MIRKTLLGALMLAALSSTVWAQTPKVEVTGIIGWALSEGVSGAEVKAQDGNFYNRVDPKDSLRYGASVGFFVNPSTEIGFMWRRQATEFEVSGTSVRTLGDVNIDGYHGYGAFYFGDPDAKARPYISGRHRRDALRQRVVPTRLDGTSASTPTSTRLSTTWGGGLSINASPSVGMKLGVQWTPTYIKSDAVGWWCDPWWGCYVIGDARYTHQFEFVGGLSFRF